MTKQRQLILDVLRGTDGHPTADTIYEQVRKMMPHISLGTIYRNLRVLIENGEIQELNYGSSHSRFDGNPSDHYHFVCRKCRAVTDLDLPLQQEINALADAAVKGRVDSHRLEIYGQCENCCRKACVRDPD
jgi:Fe2+ or Zn2+ uptake regulation protein